jgi:hypothetical protein
MGLLPDMLPGYTPIGPIDTQDPSSKIALEYSSPTSPGLDLLEIFDAAAKQAIFPRSTSSERIPSRATASIPQRSRAPSSWCRRCS